MKPAKPSRQRTAHEPILGDEEMHRQLFNLVSDAIVLVDSRSGQVLEVNAAAATLYGYSRDEWLTMKHTDVSAEPKRTRQAALERVESIPIRWHRRRDGTVFPVEITASHFEWRGRPVHLAAIRDVTERHRAEEVLTLSEQKYRRLYQSTLDGYVAVAMGGHILECNQAYLDMLGYTADEIRERTYVELTPARWHKYEADVIARQVLVRGYSDVYEKEYIRKDGTVIPIELRTHLIRDSNGNPEGMWGFVRDITERKRAAEALHKAHDELEHKVRERTARLRELTLALTRTEQRERRRIAHVLHEDLQQLLVAAKFRVGELVEGARDGALHRLADSAQQALDRALQISRSLTTDLRPPVLYELGLVAALDWLAHDMRDRFGLTVVVRAAKIITPASDDIRIMAFESVRELLLNVVKHAGVKTAEVRVAPLGAGQLRIEVADKGVGFDPAQATSRTFGLFNLRERAEGVGGTFTVTSKPRRGTCVALVLPTR